MVAPLEYNERVLRYLEYLEYPDLVLDFDPDDVGRAIGRTVRTFYEMGISFRMCALTIYGLTWAQQITQITGTIQ